MEDYKLRDLRASHKNSKPPIGIHGHHDIILPHIFSSIFFPSIFGNSKTGKCTRSLRYAAFLG